MVGAAKAAAGLVTSRVLLLFIAKVTEVTEAAKVTEFSAKSSAVSLSKSIMGSEVAEAFLEVSEVAEVT